MYAFIKCLSNCTSTKKQINNGKHMYKVNQILILKKYRIWPISNKYMMCQWSKDIIKFYSLCRFVGQDIKVTEKIKKKLILF